MSANEEEQALEIEALQSIFEEGKEFVSISPTEFLLKLIPFPAGEEENHVGVTLHVTYTPEYPESPPEWEFQDVKLSDQKADALKEMVEEIVSSSLGTVMVYSMAEACQDYLKENNQKSLSMHEEMMKRQAAENGDEEEDEEGEDDEDDDDNRAEEEWKGLAEKELPKEEDRVSDAEFLAWKQKFDAELVATGVLKREQLKAKTGRQIFCEAGAPQDGKEGGKAGAGEAAEGGGPAVYNAALFGEDDADLDDLDDLEEDDG
mmetsp:Transcript_41640/g.109924  ORF Transcript_41640/g.109924 Transcript_41640/m.109924 type:complete len:261 (-) Transcript_41640:72-854(-)